VGVGGGKGGINERAVEREIERIQWERQMIDQIESGLTQAGNLNPLF